MAAATTVRPEPGGIVLRTERLTKRFGELVAVSELDLEVRAGEVHGFLGPNGSGKSTTVGMVLELIEPTSGRIERFGELAQSVGAIVETPAFYPYLSGRDNLRALALAAGGDGVKQIDALLEEVGLAARASSPYRTYSLGMKQRLGIAATLLTDPALVILDEPTNGLDPAGQQEIRELIPRLAHEGRGVLLASHLLHEVEQICDRVTIIRRGKLIETGVVDELLSRGRYLAVTVAEPQRAAALLQPLPFIDRVEAVDGRLHVFAPAERGSDITHTLADAGLYVAALTPHQNSLEEIFLALTGEAASGSADLV